MYLPDLRSEAAKLWCKSRAELRRRPPSHSSQFFFFCSPAASGRGKPGQSSVRTVSECSSQIWHSIHMTFDAVNAQTADCCSYACYELLSLQQQQQQQKQFCGPLHAAQWPEQWWQFHILMHMNARSKFAALFDPSGGGGGGYFCFAFHIPFFVF